MWEQTINTLTTQMNDEMFPPHLVGPWSKLKVYAARLALVVHCLRHVTYETDEENVDGESVRRAGVLVRYFGSQARKVYATIGSDREVENARRVLRWIAREKRSEFKRWEVHKDLKSQERFPRIEDLDPPLSRLEKHRYVRRRKPEERQGPGRTADPVFEVNPLWDHRENRVNRVNAPQGAPEPGGDAYLPDSSDLPDEEGFGPRDHVDSPFD